METLCMKCGKRGAITKRYALIYDNFEQQHTILALVSLDVCRGCMRKAALGRCVGSIVFAILGLIGVIALSAALSEIGLLWWGALFVVGGGFINLVKSLYNEIKFNKNLGHVKVMWGIYKSNGAVPYSVVINRNLNYVPAYGDIPLKAADKYDAEKALLVEEDTAGAATLERVRYALSTGQIV